MTDLEDENISQMYITDVYLCANHGFAIIFWIFCTIKLIDTNIFISYKWLFLFFSIIKEISWILNYELWFIFSFSCTMALWYLNHLHLNKKNRSLHGYFMDQWKISNKPKERWRWIWNEFHDQQLIIIIIDNCVVDWKNAQKS